MDTLAHLSRKDFIKCSALAMSGLALTPGSMAATSSFSNDRNISLNGKLNLKNVRLETGFEHEEEKVMATKTGLFYLEIENGKISKIAPNQSKPGLE